MSLTNIALARHALSISNEASIWAEHAIMNDEQIHGQFDAKSSQMLITRLERKIEDLKIAAQHQP